ncbi:MAG: alcohol dehydrogenase catalytic domain-containing protein [Bryobacteraceae bacterium]|nr:alcohol dehydrogenase catalytic domain-containing protein [Bryobacteraceae bacterium]
MIAVHLEDGKVEVREAAVPPRNEGYALVRVLAAGICNTDLELQRGYYGFAGRPGHEFVGEVVESDAPELAGQRVVGEINLACGACEWCARDLGRHCPNRTVLGIVGHPGAFAEYLTLPNRNLRVVPPAVTTEQAVFVEPLAAACEILEQARIPPGDRVAVLGDGKLGLLVGQALKAHGAEVHQYGRHREKLAIAERAGIWTQADGDLPPRSYDWVVEATGSRAGLEAAARMVRPRGTVIMKSTIHDAVQLDTAPLIVDEITLIGSRCGRFEPALDLLERGAVQVDAMISERLPLRKAPEAFEAAARKGVLKVLLLAD